MKNKLSAWVLGAVFALILMIGLLLLIPLQWIKITLAVIVICLSICFGMLTLHPVFLFTLVLGVCMLLVPSWIMAIILIFAGTAGMIITPIFYKKNDGIE